MRKYELDISYEGNMPNEVEFTLDDRYVVKIGDERFYNLMGETMLSAFNGLVHPDDVTTFEHFVNSDMSEEYCVVRCLIKNGAYRWMLLLKKKIYNVGSERMVKLVAQDIIVISNDFDMYYHRVRKYRALMNVIEEKIFEYDPESRMLTIYCYRNNKSEIFERIDLIEWRESCIDKGYVTGDDVIHFEALCTSMLSGMSSFTVKFSSSIMSRGERVDNLVFNGQALMTESDKRLTVGVISEPDKRTRVVQEHADLDEAKLDSATGIYNKKAITDMITEEINKAAADNKNRPMYLMILNIDNFKSVNDSYGHYFGDEVIKSFADSLRISVGGRGLVGRIGGDEFMVLLKDVSVEEVRIMLKSMRKGLKMLLAQKQPEYLFSTSIGISQFSKDGTDFETLFKIADAALYIAKEKGKDRYIIYDYDKHGNILADMKHDIAFGNEFMKPMAKYELAANIVMKVSLGQMKVMDVLSEIMDKLNIHGISIFAGNDMKCIYSTGHYKIKVENASYIYKDGYESHFDEYGINCVNNIASLTINFPEAFGRLRDNNICSFIQMKTMGNDEQEYTFEFDIFGTNRRKWSDTDISMLKMIVLGMTNAISGRLTD